MGNQDKTIQQDNAFWEYKRGGLYFVDYYRAMEPVHGYSTLRGVVETLYYSGHIAEKSVSALMSA